MSTFGSFMRSSLLIFYTLTLTPLIFVFSCFLILQHANHTHIQQYICEYMYWSHNLLSNEHNPIHMCPYYSRNVLIIQGILPSRPLYLTTDLNLYLRGLLAHSGAGSPPHHDSNDTTCGRKDTLSNGGPTTAEVGVSADLSPLAVHLIETLHG